MARPTLRGKFQFLRDAVSKWEEQYQHNVIIATISLRHGGLKLRGPWLLMPNFSPFAGFVTAPPVMGSFLAFTFKLCTININLI